MKTKPSEILLINYYRGFAAFSVLIYHVAAELRNRFPHTNYLVPLKSFDFGVDFFFVLSGFIIFYIHKKDIAHREKIFSFLRKRFVRIFPVYWILLTIALLAFIATKSHLSHIGDAPIFLIKSYFLYPLPTPILPPSWTLSYELFFYALFSLFILLKQTKLLLTLLAAYVLFLFFNNFFLPHPFFSSGWLGVVTNTLVLDFFLGAGAGYLFFKLPKLTAQAAKKLILLSAILLLIDVLLEMLLPFWNVKYRLLGFALPAALLLFASAKYEQTKPLKKIRVLHFWGNASYSLYLSQAFLLLIFFKFVYLSHLPATLVTIPLLAILAIIFVLILSGLFHMLVEKRLLLWLKK